MLVPLTAKRGPAHSLYANVVSPWKITVVSSGRLVISRVTPAGTVRESRMMVEHDDFDLEADEYPRVPVNLQVAARASMALSTSLGLGAGVGSGAATGAGLAKTDLAATTSKRAAKCCMITNEGD